MQYFHKSFLLLQGNYQQNKKETIRLNILAQYCPKSIREYLIKYPLTYINITAIKSCLIEKLFTLKKNF
jgi:hypothetical protein